MNELENLNEYLNSLTSKLLDDHKDMSMENVRGYINCIKHITAHIDNQIKEHKKIRKQQTILIVAIIVISIIFTTLLMLGF